MLGTVLWIRKKRREHFLLDPGPQTRNPESTDQNPGGKLITVKVGKSESVV
jgi:hypothetical protein